MFLPVALIAYFSCGSLKSKNIILTVLSLLFYSWGEPVWVVLLVISALTDFTIGKLIHRYRNQTLLPKFFLALSLAINLGLLAVFKYLVLLKPILPIPNIALPIGISFYTFQTLSYSIDVYLKKAKVQRSFLDFLLFVSLFPQLIAGPILRYTDLAEQLSHREHSFEKISRGIIRFLVGLCKKVLIANHAGYVASTFLDFGTYTPSAATVWYGIFMFSLQIYFDFSGYSDMAIGLGKMFGFSYPENFNYPYISRSVTEFWRRWHISLGQFFRDYVYIPLGGNRYGQIRNIAVVWFLTGLWHGASFNFALWGLYYAVLLIFEKFVLLRLLNAAPRFVGYIYMIFVTLIGWCIFYFTEFSELSQALLALITFSSDASYAVFASLKNNIIFIPIAILASTPVLKLVKPYINERARTPIAITFAVLSLFICTAMLASDSYNPFLYFRF